jgi:DNA-binding beta-propeller fold protein YncE
LGTGAVTFALGIALASGAGVAHADASAATKSPSPAGNEKAQDSTAKAVQPVKNSASKPAEDSAAKGASTVGTPSSTEPTVPASALDGATPAPVSTPSSPAHVRPVKAAPINQSRTLRAAAVADARPSGSTPEGSSTTHLASLQTAVLAAHTATVSSSQATAGANTSVHSASAVQTPAAPSAPVATVATTAVSVGTARGSVNLAPMTPTTPAVPLGLAPLALLIGAANPQPNVQNFTGAPRSATATAAVTSSAPPATGIPAQTAVATIPVDPFQIALSSDGSRLYGTGLVIANGAPSATVQVVNTATNTQTGNPIPIGTMPVGITFDAATNRVYTTAVSPKPSAPGQYADTLVAIDPATNTVIGATPIGLNQFSNNTTFPSPVMGGSPSFQALPATNVAISPDGTRVYVLDNYATLNQANPSASSIQATVFMFDAKTLQPVGNPIALGAPYIGLNGGGGSTAGQILTSRTGNLIYATTGSRGPTSLIETIHAIDPNTGAVVGTPIVVTNSASAYTSGSMVLSPDGTKLYVETAPTSSNGGSQVQSAQQVTNATVLTYNTSTGQQIGTPIQVVGSGPLAITPDGATLYVADIADSRTGKTGTYQPMLAYGSSTRPSTETLYEGSVTAYNASTGKQIGDLTTVGLVPTAMAVNSAGTHVYVANSGDNTVSVINVTPASTGGGQNFVQALFISLQTWTNALGQSAQTWVTDLANSTQQWINQLAAASQAAQAQLQQQYQALLKRAQDTVTSWEDAINKTISGPGTPPGPATPSEALYEALRVNTKNAKDGIYTELRQAQAGGPVTLVVYLGGTTSDITNQSAFKDLPDYQGEVDPKQQMAIYSALDQAKKIYHQGPINIMLVGFSQGGMDAQNLASQVDFLYGNVTTIVTYASPIVGSAAHLRNNPNFVDIVDNGDIVPQFSNISYRDLYHQEIQNKTVFTYSSANDNALKYNPWLTLVPGANLGLGALHGDYSTYEQVARAFDNQASSYSGYTNVENDINTYMSAPVVWSHQGGS